MTNVRHGRKIYVVRELAFRPTFHKPIKTKQNQPRNEKQKKTMKFQHRLSLQQSMTRSDLFVIENPPQPMIVGAVGAAWTPSLRPKNPIKNQIDASCGSASIWAILHVVNRGDHVIRSSFKNTVSPWRTLVRKRLRGQNGTFQHLSWPRSGKTAKMKFTPAKIPSERPNDKTSEFYPWMPISPCEIRSWGS